LNALPSFGEEWGWRGWLYPTLRRYGTWPAILISGLIWGAWHAPLTLLGYNYALLGPWSALMFLPFCIAFGAVLAWTREFTGSVWPAVAAHGGFNGSTGLVLLFGAAGQEVNFALVGPISVVGIVLFALIAGLLFRLAPGRPPESGEPTGSYQPTSSQPR
jgi:membrane protease YdiL (CAAX protease family)